MPHGTFKSIFPEKPRIGGLLCKSEGTLKCLKSGIAWQISTRDSLPTSVAPLDSSHMPRPLNRFRFIRLAFRSLSPVPGFPMPFEIGLQFASFGFCNLLP